MDRTLTCTGNDLLQIADAYVHAFPEGHTPLHILARMTEELGEVASAVAHLERHGSKVSKLGEPNLDHLADEIEDLIHCALSLVRYYQVEDQFDQAVSTTLDALHTTGHLEGRSASEQTI